MSEAKRKYICFDKNMERRVFSMRETAERHAVGEIEEYVLATPANLAPMTVKEISAELSTDPFTRAIAEDRIRNPAWFQCVEIGVRMAEKRYSASMGEEALITEQAAS